MEKGFYFTQPENVVMFDKEITATAKIVYCAILKHINVKTRECSLYLKTLAEEVGRSVRTVQRSLAQLIEKKLIIRTERYGADGRNIASNFKVTLCPETEACVPEIPQENNTVEEQDRPHTLEAKTRVSKVTPNGDTSGGLINDIIYNNMSTLRGSYTPSCGENLQGESQQQEIKQDPNQEKEEAEAPTLKRVPEVMRATARYLLLRTGRKCLEWYEIPLLQFLSSCHKPGRVQKEIDRACEIFIKKGRKLITLSFRYIAACLKKQKTFTPWEKSEKKTPPKIQAYEDWAAEYGDLITGGATATDDTWEAQYGDLIVGGATA
ncbi:MAG: helix-turn-helix domain-containing protein [Synergistaceae bacterium]|nr:helix-turn-helix domain-containing protein [Synergistaceae bacterium]